MAFSTAGMNECNIHINGSRLLLLLPVISSNGDFNLVGIVILGALAGYVISLSTSGILCDTGFLGGWPLPFYVFGKFGSIT